LNEEISKQTECPLDVADLVREEAAASSRRGEAEFRHELVGTTEQAAEKVKADGSSA
jgi:hypothetical protein